MPPRKSPEQMSLRERFLANDAVLAVRCPTCKAPVGTRCTTKAGNYAPDSHGSRVNARDADPMYDVLARVITEWERERITEWEREREG